MSFKAAHTVYEPNRSAELAGMAITRFQVVSSLASKSSLRQIRGVPRALQGPSVKLNTPPARAPTTPVVLPLGRKRRPFRGALKSAQGAPVGAVTNAKRNDVRRQTCEPRLDGGWSLTFTVVEIDLLQRVYV